MLAKYLMLLGLGFNLGNRFDNTENPNDIPTVNKLLDDYRIKGYDTVRIPVTWIRGTEEMIRDVDFMTKLHSAVDHSINLGFKVIIDAHHEHWLIDNYTRETKRKFGKLWKQIANEFKDKSNEDVIFDVLNEPHSDFGDAQTKVDSIQSKRTREINEIGYNSIRSISKNRMILVEVNGMSNIYAENGVYPNKTYLPGKGKDPRVAVSLHIYGPTEFCLPDGGNPNYFDTIDQLREHVSKTVDKVINLHKKTGIYFHIGEFGVGYENQDKRNNNKVRAWYYYMTLYFMRAKVPVTAWCDSGMFALRSKVGKWVYGLADAMISAAHSIKNTVIISKKNVILNDSAAFLSYTMDYETK